MARTDGINGLLQQIFHGRPAAPVRPPAPEEALRDRDGRRAERAQALATIIASEHWWAVRDVLTEGFDETLEAITTKHVHPDALGVYTGLVEKLDATFKIGKAAMERIVARQLTGVSAVQQAQPRPGIPGRLTTPRLREALSASRST